MKLIRKTDGAVVEVSLSPRLGEQLAKYTLAADITRGADSAKLKDDSGLKVGGLLLLFAGTDRELVQIVGFRSVHFACPMQHTFQAGSTVIRSDPMAGQDRIE